MSFPQSITPQNGDSPEITLLKCLKALGEIYGALSGGGGGAENVAITAPLGAQAAAAAVATVPAKVTQTPGNLAASATINIPIGSVGWSVVCFTGTISITVGANAATALPAGFSASDPNIVGAQIAVTAASASTGYVQFGT